MKTKLMCLDSLLFNCVRTHTYMCMMCLHRNACQATHVEVREQLRAAVSPLSNCRRAAGIKLIMRVARQIPPPSEPPHWPSSTHVHFNAISRPYCLSYLISCSFSFIFLCVDPETDWTLIVQWLTVLDQKLVQTIHYLTSPVLGTLSTSEPPLPGYA